MCFAACGGVYAGAGYTKETVVEAGTYRLGNEPHPQGFSLRMRDAALSSAPLLPSIQQEVPRKGREPSRGTFFMLCHPRWLEAASPPSFRFFTAYMMAAPPERTIRTTPAATCALFRRHRSWGTPHAPFRGIFLCRDYDLAAKSKLPPKPSGSMGIPSELYLTDADSWTTNTLLSNGIGRKNGCYRICAGLFIVNSPAQIFYSSSSKAVLLRPMYALHHHGRFH